MPPISKQGNALLRFLLVEATQMTVRSDQHWRSQVLSPGHAAWAQDRQSRDGPQADRRVVEMWRCGCGVADGPPNKIQQLGSHEGKSVL
jgi:hypothetical protein